MPGRKRRTSSIGAFDEESGGKREGNGAKKKERFPGADAGAWVLAATGLFGRDGGGRKRRDGEIATAARNWRR